jgi:predicted TPR repeat methyltransferase
MVATASRSSGNLVADRRYTYAMDLAAAGEHAAAADLIEQALELVPDWPEGWSGLAAAREAAGDRTGAVAAYARAAACDPTDRLGATLHLARLGAAAAPAAPPVAYVRDLFDAYAGDFEHALVDRLGYGAPALLAAAIERAAPGRQFHRALDLGCGTGLMAAAIRTRVERIEGVDLAPAMVRRARAKGLYAEVRLGEIVADLTGGGARYDLVVAADVFCYLGDLAPVLTAARRRMETGGLIAFSVERGDGDAVSLGDGLRYRHGADGLAAVLAATGWRDARFTAGAIRRDRGAPVAGLYITAVAGD